MKKRFAVALMLGVALTAGVIGRTVRAEEAKKAAAMKTYIVETKHTGPGCVAALDELQSKNLLSKSYFGCMSGDHRAWTTIQAENKEAALKMFPADEQADAQITEVGKFSEADLKAIHAKHG